MKDVSNSDFDAQASESERSYFTAFSERRSSSTMRFIRFELPAHQELQIDGPFGTGAEALVLPDTMRLTLWGCRDGIKQKQVNQYGEACQIDDEDTSLELVNTTARAIEGWLILSTSDNG